MQLAWNANDAADAASRCNGCGTCRIQVEPSRMCPFVENDGKEELSPRAKADLFRRAICSTSGKELLADDSTKKILESCFNCKQCQLDCPSEVNIPHLVLEARALGLPMVLVLNMSDMDERRGIQIDREVLARELGMAVLATVGVRGDGAQELLAWLDSPAAQALKAPVVAAQEAVALDASPLDAQTQVIRTHQQVHRPLELAVRAPAASLRVDDRIDAVVLHPVWGMLLLLATLFLMFQAVFTWASVPTDWINAGVE